MNGWRWIGLSAMVGLAVVGLDSVVSKMLGRSMKDVEFAGPLLLAAVQCVLNWRRMTTPPIRQAQDR